jgi:deoxycytidylate deaminase
LAEIEADAAAQPELVFGLVGPLGTDLTLVASHLSDALAQVRYRSEVFRLSRLMREIPKEPWSTLKDGPRDEEIEEHIKAGNELRRALDRKDAVAMLGVGAVREYRYITLGDPNKPLAGFAAIFHSLKRPEEIEALRRIYGPAFLVLAAYAPRARRVQDLARRIAESRYSHQTGQFLSKAERLITTDEAEVDNPFGQNVRDSFALADVIVNAGDAQSLDAAITRFIDLLFGNSLHTPNRDEQGMYIAHVAALRSASLARQVGVAICRRDGSVVSIGCNEVPRTGGGQYWCGDEPDGRDFRIGYDSSDRMREILLGDILERLKSNAWLSAEKSTMAIKDMVVEALRGCERPIMKGAQFTATVDYVRAVHAEMAAITDAVRHGVSTVGCELFTTTFPCHDCAKHIVAAGIERVVYVEPYPKSLVGELYPDSIQIDSVADCPGRMRIDAFVGIAPKRYAEFFSMMERKRKQPDGTVAVWRRAEAVPRLPEYMPSVVARLTGEAEAFKRFENDLKAKIGTTEKSE